jgi:sensor histidine kinase YesM
MLPPAIESLLQAVYVNKNYRFWACQLSGWGAYSLANFLSITVVDENVSWPHLVFISLSAVLGILFSWPLRPLYRSSFDLSMARRTVVALVAIFVLSGVWTFLRIYIWALMAVEEPLWNEFHYWYFGSLFVFLSWTVLYYGINYYELLTLEHQKLMEESAHREREKFRRMHAESLARDAQLQMLRYQLNPHFLFNTLNAINALVRVQDSDKAGEMIQLLSDFLRHALEQDGVENVSLEQELETLMLYLNIEKTRFQDRLTLEFDIEPEARSALVPGLILQPIVENSMKYAIASSEDGGTVSVKARVRDDELQLEVLDTGPGMEDESKQRERGVGLRNTVDRLRTLYQDRFVLETANRDPSGLAVHIRFPLQLA